MTPNQTLSHFKILDRIGEGGMGAVFRAEDLSLRRKVALKFLAPEAEVTAEQRARFLREARTAAALNHPNICTVHEVGEVEEDTTVTHASGVTHIPAGTPFLSMELIEGATLQEALARSPEMTLPELLNVAVQVAEGLAEAHSHKIVHRDLKPGNVMVTPAGRVKILDFGLAKPMEPRREEEAGDATQVVSGELTLSGQVLGTFSSMSPEQVQGRAVDSRADVFAFGTLLYEMAAGRNPFAGVSPTETMAKVLEAEPEPLAKLRPDLPRRLAEIIERCLQKKPEDRYADTRELAKELRGIQDGVRTAELKRWRRRPERRSLEFAAVIIVVLLAAVTVYLRKTVKGALPESSALSANRVAIFPFTVQGPERFAYLSEGMVDLLGALVDGAGELRTVDAFALSHRMKSEGIQVPDEESGRRLAGQMNAGFYLLGSIAETDGHLQATCSLYQVDGGPSTTAAASVDEEPQLYELVQDLARQLLADWIDVGETGIDLAAQTTGSIEALKNYLRGEQFRRAGQFNRAVDAYQQAVDADSTFALGWCALGLAANYTYQTELGREASGKAMELRDALPQRDRLMVEAQDAFAKGAFDKTERLCRAILEIHPDDPVIWYGLAQILLVSWKLRGRSPEEAHRLMQRAREEGMPQDTPSLISMYARAAQLAGQYKEAAEWERRFLELFPEAEFSPQVRARSALEENDNRAWQEALGEARQLDDTELSFVADTIWLPKQRWLNLRTLEAAQQVARIMTESTGRSAGARAYGHFFVAHLENAKGRPAAAMAELDRARPLDPAMTLEYEALFAVSPFPGASRVELEGIEARLLAWDAESVEPPVEPNPFLYPNTGWHPELRQYLLGMISTRLGEAEAAEGYAGELERSAETPDESVVGAIFAQSIRVHLAVARGDSAAALDELQNMTHGPSWVLSLSPFFSRSLDRYLLAELLAARGQSEEALLWFEGLVGADAYLGPSHRRRGEILERLGRTEEALEHYRRFLDLWQNCDAELRPQWNEVKTRVEALGGSS